jgi:hypothetical protein
VKSFRTKVVGVTKKNEDGSSRQKIIKQCRKGDSLFLVRDPANKFDSNAIEVRKKDATMVGYLSGELAEDIAPIMDGGKRLAATVLDVTGGGPGESYGLNIQVVEIPGKPFVKPKQKKAFSLLSPKGLLLITLAVFAFSWFATK